MSKKKIGWRIVFLLFLIIATINIVLQQRNTPYQHDEGQVFGTYYHITYQNDTSLNGDIMAELKEKFVTEIRKEKERLSWKGFADRLIEFADKLP